MRGSRKKKKISKQTKRLILNAVSLALVLLAADYALYSYYIKPPKNAESQETQASLANVDELQQSQNVDKNQEPVKKSETRSGRGTVLGGCIIALPLAGLHFLLFLYVSAIFMGIPFKELIYK